VAPVPAWGPLGAVCVLRPWAERLVDALRPRPGERILDLSRDGGLLRRHLERAGGRVIVPGRWLVPSDAVDTVTSLCSLQLEADPAATLAGLVGAMAPQGGRVFVLVQVAGEGSPHETAVAGVLGGVARPATLSEAEIDALAAAPPPLRAERLRDVVRFDGLDALWAALVTERGITEALDPGRREGLEAALRRWTAADGTLRIPVEAALLSAPSSPGSRW